MSRSFKVAFALPFAFFTACRNGGTTSTSNPQNLPVAPISEGADNFPFFVYNGPLPELDSPKIVGSMVGLTV